MDWTLILTTHEYDEEKWFVPKRFAKIGLMLRLPGLKWGCAFKI